MTETDGTGPRPTAGPDAGSDGSAFAPMLPVAIVASFVVFAPDVLAGIEPPKTFVAGLILGATIVQSVFTGAWRGAVASWRATWSTGDPWRRAGIASVVAFLVVVGAATATSIVPRSSLLGTLNRGQGTLFFATMVVAIAASWPTLRTPTGARSIVRAIAAGGFIPAVVAIVQSVGYDLIQGGPSTTDRAAGTLGNPVNLGTMMAMSAIAAMALAYEAWSSSHSSAKALATAQVPAAAGPWRTPRVTRGVTPIIVGAVGVSLTIAARLVGIVWPHIEWGVVPVAVSAAAMIAWPSDAPVDVGGGAPRRISRLRAVLWVIVAIACMAAIGASRSRGPAVALGVGAGAWVTLAVLPRQTGLTARGGVAVATVLVVTVGTFGAGSALPAAVRAVRALPEGAIGGGGAMAEVQAQVQAIGRDTIGTRQIAWTASLDAYRYGSRNLDPRWLGTSMASSGHQIADLDSISALPDHRVVSSTWRRIVGYGPEAQVALIGTDAAGQPFDRAHAAPLDILLAHGAIGLASAALLAVSTVVISIRSTRTVAANDADLAVVPILLASGVASLTGVDGTSQVLSTWALVALVFARQPVVPSADVHLSRADTPPGGTDQRGVPTTPGGYRSPVRALLAGASITAVGIVAAMVAGDRSTDPTTWIVAVGSSVCAATLIGSRMIGAGWAGPAGVARAVVAPVVVASIAMTPAWAALAAGAEARAATSPDVSVDDRQAGLSRAVTLDPGVVTYRQLRGI